MGEEKLRRVLDLGAGFRLGSVILFDDMEDVLKWSFNGTGGDDVHEKSTTVAYNKDASLHLKTRVTGQAVGDNLIAIRKLCVLPNKRVGLEFYWKFAVAANLQRVFFELTFYDGTKLHTQRVYYQREMSKWQYLDVNNAVQDVTGGAQSLQAEVWHKFSMVADFGKDKYGKVVSDSKEFDLSSITGYSVASALSEELKLELRIYATAAGAAEVWFDDVLVHTDV